MTPRPALIPFLLAGSITIALSLTSHATAQVVLLSDLRRVTLNATASSVMDTFSATPSAPFADFDVPTTTVSATFGTSSVDATAS